MARPRKVVTQPRSIRLTEELDSYVGTLPHGEFTRLVMMLLSKHAKEQGIDLTKLEKEMK